MFNFETDATGENIDGGTQGRITLTLTYVISDIFYNIFKGNELKLLIEQRFNVYRADYNIDKIKTISIDKKEPGPYKIHINIQLILKRLSRYNTRLVKSKVICIRMLVIYLKK